MGAFKAYDIRGIYGEEITEVMAYRIGYYLPGILQAGEILVGRDARLSSASLCEALIEGITAAGVDVVDAGLCTTPMVYFASGKHGFSGSVQVTASHNPANYNGMKVSGRHALPVGYDTGLAVLEEMIRKDPKPAAVRGKVLSMHLKEDYLAFLLSHKKQQDFSLRLVVDTSNGMAGLLARAVFGEPAIYLNEALDGRFPAHDPNPLDPVSRQQLVGAVLDHQAGLGMIFDGDGDRVMFLDEKGSFIPPDLMIALLGHHFLVDQPGQTVLQDIRTSRAVAEYLAQWNAKVVTWRVGRAFAAPRLREINGIYGGELAGHYYFRSFFFSDSGLLAASIIYQIFESFFQQGIAPSEVMRQVSAYHNTGEINFKVRDMEKAMKAFIKYMPGKEDAIGIMDFDGYRFDFKDWWFNIRPSNTEPYLRFIAEARDSSLLGEKQALASEIIAGLTQ